MTRLSIITINYNNLEGLVRTCRSLTFIQKVSFEHVIIDGGSKDGSLDFLEKYKESSHYPCEIVSEKDRGIYDAFNKGLSLSKSKMVWFINSGDTVLPGALECDWGLLEKNIILILQYMVSFRASKWVPKTPSLLCHQAIIFPNENKIFYPDWKIYGDAKYIEQQFSTHKQEFIMSSPVIEFEMGGISNTPSFKRLLICYSELPTNKFFKEVVKFFLTLIFGENVKTKFLLWLKYKRVS